MTEQTTRVQVEDTEFTFSLETDVRPRVRTALEPCGEGHLIRLVVEADEPFYLHDLSVTWTVPIVEMHGLYFGGNPRAELSHLPFWHLQKSVRANTGVPFLALIHRNGENRHAVGLFDQITETQLSAHLSESTRCYHFKLQKPAGRDASGQPIPAPGRWEEVVFVSNARRPWPEVLGRYTCLNDRFTNEPKLRVPEAAFEPVFCSWTAIHHDVSHDWVMRQAGLAAELGFGTWITDDGWFLERGTFGDYSCAGDWQPCPTKFPDFGAHVRAVQALGLRYVLWVAPFMVGKDSGAAQRYRHLLAPGQARERFDNLSPWHPETKGIVTDLLTRLVTDYGLDGLKIDFIDAVAAGGERPAGADEATFGRSLFETLGAAIDALAETNPELLIEVRNSYANLASRRYANLYRSSDVPVNFALNRWQAVMLRLLAPDRAVHLDPALWHPADTDENVAAHLINCLVSVPMVSVELDRYPQRHLELIRYWIGFYNAHRRTLVHGDFRPTLHHGYVPAVTFVGEEETIVGLYDDLPVALPPAPRVWVLNASTRPYVDLSGDPLEGTYRVTERDKFGHVVAKREVSFPVPRLTVEVGGSLELGAP